jgi:hypothetical protein
MLSAEKPVAYGQSAVFDPDIIVIMVEIDPAACRRWLIPEDHS